MLNSNDKRPLYIQLADTLQAQIGKDYQVEDRLPTEKELCEEYSVSRTTARLAMSELEQRGVVYRVQGRGSFVASPPIAELNTLLDFDFAAHCENMISSSFTIQTLSVTHEVTDFALLQLFGARQKHDVCRIEGLILNEEKPFALEYAYLKAAWCEPAELAAPPLEEILAKIQTKIGSVREKYIARLATKREKELLEIVYAPILQITKYAHDEEGNLMLVLERRMVSRQTSYQNFLFKEWQ